MPLSGPLARACVLVLLLGAFFFAASPAFARTWVVSAAGDGDALTIPEGIALAADVGDTVEVWPGTYTDRILFGGKRVHLIGRDGPLATEIQGTGIRLDAGTADENLIQGFHIKGAYEIDGGAVRAIGCGLTVRNCWFVYNRINNGTSSGGAIYAESADPGFVLRVRDCLFERNETRPEGAAIRLRDGVRLEAIGCTFLGNKSVKSSGAAISLRGPGHTIVDCLFEANEASYSGGAVFVSNGDLVVSGSVFDRNGATELGGTIRAYGSTLTVTHCSFLRPRVWYENHDTAHIWLEGNASGSIQNCILAFGNVPAYCDGGASAVVENNVIWEPAGMFYPDLAGSCLDLPASNRIEDPAFCDLDVDYRVSDTSPALQIPGGAGPFLDPGCVTPVEPTTWGGLKLRYGSGDPR